jgi:ABC-type transporter Mla subunit MlaD
MRSAMAEFTKLAAELRGQQAGIAEALRHVNRLGMQLERGDGLAAMLLADPKPAAQLRAALPKLNSALDELNKTLHGARALADHLPQIGEDMEAAMKTTRSATAEAQRLVASLPELKQSAQRTLDATPGVLLQSQETMHQIQRLTEGVQRSWLVRDTMEAPPSGSRLRSDGVGTDR